ncbi:hypothetical protein N7481_004403 [Penicillium waksmanii]|uniref:uncharacterized protein n=1 Tax=Penicillium waksmanii TaxID=69791 RepID=UPI002546BD08|nr:uncharacterized protein N7481_004403 [Penicillium waksmanii]KAJ5989193.1 hypothetical protein N7481_004403 [Penicillium waksmanii]
MPPETATEKDYRFMAECFKNIDHTRGKVDMVKVAAAMGYGNPRSAGNRYKVLKTKHGFATDCFFTGSTGAALTSPKKGIPRAKKTPIKKGKQGGDDNDDDLTEDENVGIKEEKNAEGEAFSSDPTTQDEATLSSPKKRGSRAKKAAVKKEGQVKDEHDLDQTEEENAEIKEEEEEEKKDVESDEEI